MLLQSIKVALICIITVGTAVFVSGSLHQRWLYFLSTSYLRTLNKNSGLNSFKNFNFKVGCFLSFHYTRLFIIQWQFVFKNKSKQTDSLRTASDKFSTVLPCRHHHTIYICSIHKQKLVSKHLVYKNKKKCYMNWPHSMCHLVSCRTQNVTGFYFCIFNLAKMFSGEQPLHVSIRQHLPAFYKKPTLTYVYLYIHESLTNCTFC